MKSSEQINELAAALAKAQGKMIHASKDRTNPHFGSKYADLASVLDACREPLAENNLAVLQLPSKEDGAWVLNTRLTHASGQWIESQCPILSMKADAQGFGSGLTYSRRYGLSAMVGIAQDDDDGNGASEKQQINQKKEYKKAVDPAPVSTSKLKNNEAPIGQAEAKFLFDVATKKGIKNEEIKEIMKGLYGIEATKDLKIFQFNDILKLMNEKSLADIGVEIVTRQSEAAMNKEELK